MYSHDEIEALTTKISWLAVDLLGDRVSDVKVEAAHFNERMGVAIQSPEGWRHAVVGKITDAMSDPEKWARAACTAIIAWLDKKAAPPEQPGEP